MTGRNKKKRITRRVALGGLGATGLAALGCGSDDESARASSGGAGGSGGTGGSAGAGGTAGSGATGGASGSAGAGGTAGSGATGGAAGSGATGGTGGTGATCDETSTLAASALLAPIDHLVVLMMENRSFDHYLGSLSLLESKQVDGLRGGESNPDGAGGNVEIFNLQDFTPADPPHGWDAAHAQFNGGANDGFVTEHAGASQNDVMGYHVRSQIPITYAMADSGAICDRWFCSVMGPTWPNRAFLHCATSDGAQSNVPTLGLKNKSVWHALKAKGVSCKNYHHGIAWATGGYLIEAEYLASIQTFFTDAASGNLPSFSIIDPSFFGGAANDDHPDHDIQLGQALLSAVYTALAQSPKWSRTLFVVTYDENGGFYDHVAPPSTTDSRPTFAQLGFRVPSLVMGGVARRGCVVSTQLDHGSVIKTAMTRWGIDAPSADVVGRLAVTSDLSSCVQPAYLNAPQPPVTLPTLTLDVERLRRRRATLSHPELADAARRAGLGRELELASTGLGQTEHVLRWGRDLGALRLR